jgi:uncharacterized membrane protein
MTSRKKKLFWIIPLAMVAIPLFIFIGGEVVKLLWNWLTPPLFGWRQITFWQALALLALCRILFGGFGHRGGSRSEARRRIKERAWERAEERCGNMTPEEREQFRRRMRERWGFGPPSEGSPTSQP